MGSFEFAFNNPKYSDRVLRLIVSDTKSSVGNRSNRQEEEEDIGDNNDNKKELGAPAIRPFKRRRYHRSSSSLSGDSTTTTTALELLCCQQRQPLTTSCISSDVCNLLDEPGEQHSITTE
jgi:hypothetical protein